MARKKKNATEVQEQAQTVQEPVVNVDEKQESVDTSATTAQPQTTPQPKKRKMLYYRVWKNSQQGKNLTELWAKCQEAEKAAREWVKQFGTDKYYEDPIAIAGGVGAVVFDNDEEVDHDVWNKVEGIDDAYMLNLPEGFSYVNYKDKDLTNEQKAVQLEMQRVKLPMVGEAQFLDCVHPQTVISKRTGKPLPIVMHKTPLWFLGKDAFWYVGVTFPLEPRGMTQILENTFYAKAKEVE